MWIYAGGKFISIILLYANEMRQWFQWNGFDFNRNFLYCTHTNNRAHSRNYWEERRNEETKKKIYRSADGIIYRKKGRNDGWALHTCIWPCGVNYLPIVLDCSTVISIWCVDVIRYAHFNIEMKLSPNGNGNETYAEKYCCSFFYLRFYDGFFYANNESRGSIQKWIEAHTHSFSSSLPIFLSITLTPPFDSLDFISSHIDLARKLVEYTHIKRWIRILQSPLSVYYKNEWHEKGMCGQNGKPRYPHTHI